MIKLAILDHLEMYILQAHFKHFSFYFNNVTGLKKRNFDNDFRENLVAKLGMKIVQRRKLEPHENATFTENLAFIRSLRHENLVQMYEELNTANETYAIMDMPKVRRSFFYCFS